jgi:hypothetical protein
MSMLRFNQRALALTATLATLAGCNVNVAPNLPTLVNSSRIVPEAAMTFAGPDREESWMSPEAAKATNLLYISDIGRYIVHVYTLPALKLVGKLTGFSQPQGECSDARGNVWIADSNTRELFEYAHGGKAPIGALLDPTGYPVACAVDLRNGNLAVSNIFDFSGAGGVLVYRHAAGTPRSYSNPHQFFYYFAGYNSAGDLYVSGQTYSHAFILSRLPKGRGVMSTVSITGGSIDFPGTVQWVRSTLVLGDQKCRDSKSSCLYEASVSGRTAKITHLTRFIDACDVAQVQIRDSRIIGGEYEHCGHGVSSTDVWAFPGGGNPIKRAGGVEQPVGAAISPR